MAGDVVIGGYCSIGGVDRSAYCESWTPNWDMEIQEWRPFNVSYVAKVGGLTNASFDVTFVDDTSYTITQYLDGAAGTSVAFELRYDDAVVSGSNPKWTGNCIVIPAAPPAVQGDLARFTATFQVDGLVTMATSP